MYKKIVCGSHSTKIFKALFLLNCTKPKGDKSSRHCLFYLLVFSKFFVKSSNHAHSPLLPRETPPAHTLPCSATLATGSVPLPPVAVRPHQLVLFLALVVPLARLVKQV